MSEISAREHLKRYRMDNRIITFDESSSTVELAAERLNCEGKRIAKSISLKINDRVILIVMAGDRKIDNQKYRHVFDDKAKMLSYDEVLDKVGHPVGGVCPFGVNEGVEIYFDESLKRFDTVFPACGSDHNAIEVSISELEQVIPNHKWIDVSK